MLFTFLIENNEFDLVIKECSLLYSLVVFKFNFLMHVNFMQVNLDALVINVKN